jgi:hypothetical protein
MISGAPVDIVTGRPLEQPEPESVAQARDAAADELQRIIAGSVSESQAADKVLTLIHEALAERIDQILQADPQAKAYQEILKKLGAVRITGEIAARQFISRRQLRPWRPTAV